MKRMSFTLRFTTPCLASGRGDDGRLNRFDRDAHNRIVFAQAAWYSAFAAAIPMSGVRGVKPGDISMHLSARADTQMFRRTYGKAQYRMHEAIVPGTMVTFECMCAPGVTHSTLLAILTKMGDYVGLSPFGHRLGFGRFTVEGVSEELINNVTDAEADQA